MVTTGDVARAQWRDLLPTAYLLTGDQATARGLVVRTLARTRRADPGDRDAALAALVATHRSRWRTTGRTTIQGDTPTPWWAAPEDVAAAHRLADELAALDRDERTAVVLRWSEDWPPDRVAALLPDVDPDAVVRRLTVDPADLPRRLDALAALADPAGLDDDEVVAAVRRVTGRRIRRTALAAASLVAVVALGVWAPTVPTTAGRGGAAGTSTAVRTPVTPPLTGLFALPPRGSLVDDDELLAGLQRRITADGVAGEGYRVLYGDDVEGVRVVLMMDPVGPRVDLAWLTGPAGADPADLDVSRFDGSFPAADTAVAVWVEDPAGGPARLVVVTDAGTDVSVSTGIDVDPVTGLAGRSYAPATATDGVVALTLDRPSGRGVRLRVDAGRALGDGRSPLVIGPDWFPAPDDGPGPPSRSGTPTASPYAYGRALADITAATGWTAEDLDVVVLGAGPAPDRGGGAEDVVSLAVVLPGGGVVTTTGMGATSSTATSTWSSWTTCGSSSYPAGTDPASLVVAATCPTPSSAATGERAALVTAVPGHAVVLTGPDGSTITPELVDGFGWATYVAAQDLATATDGGVVFPVAGPSNDALLG
ncbi:DNA-directed RNA polymerase specialized sigma subunit, sigma24 family [Klenkia soli]|uniref:DNA-directed RNA polymerase specialized sigma subunit, sigma24 family n=1 Tax=Klenkia soli TaxID=1052260 RepID=A0A1H0RTN7_9ACTN|nr:hypothetical protein [Klenkia soli]SDP32739.1 DNA-directed RNA polymerase specialized sigma subunit, sigma24 family [Klenkia soli]